MSLASNTLIQKVTANNIIGVINDFTTNVIDNAFNKRGYNSGTYPYFSGTAGYNTATNVKATTTGWTNPIAIPSGQLAADSKPSLSITDTVITASTLWNSMLTITRALAKIRVFTSNWYHKSGTTNNLVNSVSGTAVFNTSYPAVPTGTIANNQKTSNWTRSGSTSITLNPSSSISTDTTATANNINTTITNCYNAWATNCYNGNRLTYTFYTCHYNCFSEWADSRGRR